MNIYHYTYQIGRTAEKTATIEANSPEEAQLKSYELVKVKAKKGRQAVKKFICPVSIDLDIRSTIPTFNINQKELANIIESDIANPCEYITLPNPVYSNTIDSEYPFLYFLSYSTTEPCETGRLVAAIPFKLNSELKIELCEKIIADILDCTLENVVLTNFVLLKRWKED